MLVFVSLNSKILLNVNDYVICTTEPVMTVFTISHKNMNLPVCLQSPGSSRGSGPLRVCQLRVEEGMDVVNREAAHERTVQSTLQITDSLSQSWEDITLVRQHTMLSCSDFIHVEDLIVVFVYICFKMKYTPHFHMLKPFV